MPRWLPPYLHGLYATTPQEGWSGGSGTVDVDDGGKCRLEPDARHQRRDARQRALDRARAAPIGIARSGRARRRDRCSAPSSVTSCTPDSPRSSRVRRCATVIDRIGGGARPGRRVKAVLSGVSNPVLSAAQLDTPVSYEGLAEAGGGLGSAGFIVYDDTRSMVAVAQMVSRFLYVESCGQCRACKFGCGEITAPARSRRRQRAAPRATSRPSAHVCSASPTRTGASSAKRSSVSSSSLLRAFPEDFAAELEEFGAPRTAADPEDRRHPRRSRDLRRPTDAQATRLDLLPIAAVSGRA